MSAVFNRVVVSKAILLLSAMWLSQAYAASVEGVRLWRSPDSTRLVFDLDAPVEHTIFRLDSPARLVIDIRESQFSAKIQDLKLANTPVIKVRHGTQSSGDLRIVLDLKSDVNPRSFILRKIADKPDRLVVDLFDEQQTKVKTVETHTTLSAQPSRRDIIIAIDAGHGGEDPGAVGPNQIYEKTVVLKIAKNLANKINAREGYRALLVRNSDYFIRLGDRPEKARKAQADLFLSIHADGFDNPKARGASVYTLSRRGATSKMASMLASRENQSDLIGGVDRIQLDNKEDEVVQILVDLSMTSSLATSMDVGGRILKHMGSVTHLHSSHVESAGFAVLKSPDVPSLLIETGFITNPSEARKLNSLSHRTKLAKAIFKGIDSYFSAKPPAGSFLAWKKDGGGVVKYTIASGDTLSSIAKRYKVSIATIKKQNNLSGSAIRIGQTLIIPAT